VSNSQQLYQQANDLNARCGLLQGHLDQVRQLVRELEWARCPELLVDGGRDTWSGGLAGALCAEAFFWVRRSQNILDEITAMVSALEQQISGLRREREQIIQLAASTSAHEHLLAG
jgi:prefoldin subunit 5